MRLTEVYAARHGGTPVATVHAGPRRVHAAATLECGAVEGPHLGKRVPAGPWKPTAGMWSLTAKGTPSSTERGSPARQRAADASAASSTCLPSAPYDQCR